MADKSEVNVDLISTRAVTISLLVGTSCIAIGRMTVPFVLHDKKLGWKDAWLALAFGFYLALCIVYLVTFPVIFRVGAVADGSSTVYAGILNDAVEVLKVVFSTTLLHWFVLWSVKFSMLAFYKELISRLHTYLRLWWAVTIFTCLALLVSLLQFFFTCKNPKEMMFSVGACLTPTATKLSHVSLWTAFALDVTTDLLIMVLPLGLIRKARMPLRQKIGIASIFCLALVCVAIAAVRVREVGEDMTGTSTPSITWLALWSLVEASIAMIIGCGPGLFELIKRTATKHRSSNKSSNGSQGFASDSRLGRAMDMPIFKRDKGLVSTKIQVTDPASSSQEHLTDSINVTHSISMAHSIRAQFSRSGSPKPLPELPALKSQYSIHRVPGE